MIERIWISTAHGWPNQQFALLFVDWLVGNPDVRDEYLAVKRKAERASEPDGEIADYVAAKEPWLSRSRRMRRAFSIAASIFSRLRTIPSSSSSLLRSCTP